MADKKTLKKTRRRKNSESRLKTNKLKLPIESFEKDLVRAVENNDFLVVVGETGSGKTTQLPQFLHRAGFTGNGEVIGVTQPRRIAAISVASRVSEEIGCPLGAEVGYQVRFDDCKSRSTVIKYMTDGCLLREFLDDPKLSKYGVIILDEAHERSLDTDILFGLVKELFVIQNTGKNGYSPPKIIIMSATLNHQKFSEFLGDCPVFEIPGQCFLVKEIYCNYVGVKDLQTPNYVTRAVETVMSIHLEQSAGDVLLFLTGQEEIEYACDKLFERAEKIDYRHDVCCEEIEALLVLPLYGSMTTELQQRVFDPVEPWIRKVVVATNIAATSLTIDGIKYVVDSGFVKQLVFNPRTGLDSLNVVLISRSEAVQRAGRAGRTAPGKCYRLYSREVYETAMNEETLPEIQRTSLTRVVLHLKTMGVHNVLGFNYIDPPEKQMILEALRQLYYYEALDKDGNVTPLGRRMIEYPLSPGLSRAVIYSAMLGCEGLILPVAAMLSVENVFSTAGSKKQRLAASQVHMKLAEDAGGTNDFATLLYVYKQCHSSVSAARWCREHFIHWRALKMAASVCQQLQDILDRQKQRCRELQCKKVDGDSECSNRDLLRRVLCKGFFCNVARKSTSGASFRTMDGHGTTVYIHPSSTLFGCDDKLDWIIYHDIVWTSKIYMRTVCPVRYEWIKDLLPRLHDVDAFTLSGWTERQNEEQTPGWNSTRMAGEGREKKLDSQDNLEAACQTLKLSKRNTEDSVAAARERYLARKLARTQTQR